jgi:hypothetical protein
MNIPIELQKILVANPEALSGAVRLWSNESAESGNFLGEVAILFLRPSSSEVASIKIPDELGFIGMAPGQFPPAYRLAIIEKHR